MLHCRDGHAVKFFSAVAVQNLYICAKFYEKKFEQLSKN